MNLHSLCVPCTIIVTVLIDDSDDNDDSVDSNDKGAHRTSLFI